jgi:uncharacterized protein (TIGR02145 family)
MNDKTLYYNKFICFPMGRSSPLVFKNAIPKIVITLIILVFLSSYVKSQTDSIEDIQGNTYKIVQIGDQWWMAENLRATQYSNGDPIPYLVNDVHWASSVTGAYCYYENDVANSDTFGNLYNWYTVNDDRGICPSGWHVPSDIEWITLEKHLGMSASEAGRMTAWRGTNEGDKLKDPRFGGNNSSGFSALGTGYRDPQGVFKALGTDNDYWTSTPFSNLDGIHGILHGLLDSKSTVVRNFHVPGYGFCVRCIMDKITGVSTLPKVENTLAYPNPSVEQLYVRNAGGEALTITNIQGMTMLQGVITGSIHQIDISGLEPGAYILNITGGKDIYTMRFIKE